MNTQLHFPEDREKGESSEQSPANKETAQEDIQISLPKTERAEGPFEHSGETARQTAAEAEEKEQP